MHSPWGIVWMIATKTGWSVHHILWRISFANLQMMIADAPALTKGKKKITISGKEAMARRRAK